VGETAFRTKGCLRVGTEVELKLAVVAEDLRVVRRVLQSMRGFSQAETVSAARPIVSTYYNTPDLAMRDRETSLRVRRDGEVGFVQTVKSTGANVLAGGEWYDRVADERPSVAAPESGRHLKGLEDTPLRPLFVTEVSRTVIVLEPRPGTRIEASVDEGHISALDREASEPVSEVELELKAGEDRSILYDIALRLLENVPTLRLEMRSKAARGYDLVTRAVRGRSKPRDYTAAPVELDQAMTLDAALSAVGLWGMVQLL
jgi:inorganic triphosphatase YgiF